MPESGVSFENEKHGCSNARFDKMAPALNSFDTFLHPPRSMVSKVPKCKFRSSLSKGRPGSASADDVSMNFPKIRINCFRKVETMQHQCQKYRKLYFSAMEKVSPDQTGSFRVY